MVGSKEQLFKAAARRYTTVPIESLETEFRIQSLNGRELTEFVTKFQATGGKVDDSNTKQMAALLAMCLVDDNGNRLCTTKEDEAQLLDLEFAVLLPLVNACQEHNKLTDKAQGKMEKN